MKAKKQLYSAIVLVLFGLLFWASASVQKISTVESVFKDTRKPEENISVSYQLPVIKPTGNTTQLQTKGSTSISISIVPFEANRSIKKQQAITYADPEKRGFDIYEITHTPEYIISPEVIRFKMRVSNTNEDIPLELSKITFALFIDGTVWDFPEKYERTWEKGLVSSVSPKEFIIEGPQLAGLFSSKEIMINLSGVPIEYDRGGYVTKKERFVWYFQSSIEEVKKEEKRIYTYEARPIETRQCVHCNGTGTNPQPYKCGVCNGSGSYVNPYDKKTYKCSNCNATGRVYQKCNNCVDGVTYHPKSPQSPVLSSVTWNGWKVQVKSIPSGASIKGINPKTGQQGLLKCTTPCTIDWYCTSGKTCPITIEYYGESVDVYPLKPNGSESSVIVVDFRSGTPIVKSGKKMN